MYNFFTAKNDVVFQFTAVNYVHLTVIVYSSFEVVGKNTIHIAGCNRNDIVTFTDRQQNSDIINAQIKKKKVGELLDTKKN